MAAVLDTQFAGLAGADDATYNMAVELMLSDLQELRSSAKGKQRAGDVTDAEASLTIFENELRRASTMAADRRLTASIQRAIQTDANAITSANRQEQMERHDHEVAMAIAHNRPIPPMPKFPADTPANNDVQFVSSRPTPQRPNKRARETSPARAPVNEEAGVGSNGTTSSQAKKRRKEEGSDKKPTQATPAKSTAPGYGFFPSGDDEDDMCIAVGLQSIRDGEYENDVENDEDDISAAMGFQHFRKGESSAWAASRPQPETRRSCTSCMDDKPANELVKAQCEHEYCHDCIRRLFESAIADETLFPARCCSKEIPPDNLQPVLGADRLQEYKDKKIEYETVNRTYCHRPDCAVFIPLGYIEDDRALCPKCHVETCVHCKKQAHPGNCPEDHELQRVVHMGEDNGWKHCSKCKSLIELTMGCYHITCRCKHQFCYLCGVEWKKCLCPQWDEDRLLNRAREIDRRDNPNNGAQHANQDANAQHRVNGIVDNLRQGHECQHNNWRRRRGRHVCEGCNAQLPFFIFECAQCNIIACKSCRFNRF
ncbi:hypothetical protein GGR57DRAFT_463908 [Xylariaceae sp. FL1272]|nr:hypothetical protein GGR57DRAFT_463908 [Xylariaceae sp. FL1272]